MKHFLCKLIPPRFTFAEDITEDEKKLMQEHIIYWTDLVNQGTAIVFGPVCDTKGVWGVGIIEVEEEEDAHAIGAGDPVIKANRNFKFEVYPMPIATVRK